MLQLNCDFLRLCDSASEAEWSRCRSELDPIDWLTKNKTNILRLHGALLYRETREARLLDSKESDETMASEQASASADPPTPPPKPSRSARTSPECPGKHPRKSMAPIARPKRGRAVSETSTIAYASDGAWDPAAQLRSAEEDLPPTCSCI